MTPADSNKHRRRTGREKLSGCFPALFFLTAPLLSGPLAGAVALGSPFGEHMVLQRDLPVPVWGTAKPGEHITVSFAGELKSIAADAEGRWRATLDPLAASAQPRDFVVTGSASASPLILHDVLVGEVWLCGGQSNMERQLGLRAGQQPIVNWEQEVADARHPLIRQYYVPQHHSPAPQTATAGAWTVCSPATVGDFTAVGYFFARDLFAALGVPVGIVHSSVGGTPAEAWTSRAGLAGFPEMAESLAQLDRVAADPVAARRHFATSLAQWYHDNDPGSGDRPWSAPGLDESGWETMQLPTYWEDAGHPDYDGVAWFRKSFDLPTAWAGHDLTLRLSAVDDIDTTWVNGREVGATAGWDLPRTYPVPAACLRSTGNVIAVRVLDTGGNGGIWNKTLPFTLAPADGSGSPLPLAGPWLARFSHSLYAGPRPPPDVDNSLVAPTVLYNAMIAPLVPFAIRGVAFYQGEANADRPAQYRRLLPALIADWRKSWGEGNFPFLFVQIAPFRDQPPEIREAQFLAWQATNKTAMVVTIDCGDAGDIHPAFKQPVGARLALAARALAYGENIEYSGPAYSRMDSSAGQARLHFTHLGRGLMAKAGPLIGFTAAGPDGVFHPARAEISGDTVVVTLPGIATVTAVRYGWANVATGNLFNADGLPASPFRTDAP